MNFGLAFQKDITKSLSIGVGTKYISINIDSAEIKDATIGADIGALYQINLGQGKEKVNIGAGIRNIGMGLRFKEAAESLPMTIIGGMMYQPTARVSIYGEVDKPKDMGIEYGGGLELNFQNMLKPRIGYRAGNGMKITTAGVHIEKAIGSTIYGISYAMGTGVMMSHLIELKIKPPVLYKFKKAKEGEQVKMRLAIMDLAALNTPEVLAQSVSELLRTEIFKTKIFDIVERAQMKEILKEQEFQMTGCTDTECAVEIGKLLSVKKMVVGSLNKLGEMYVLNARVIDVETSKVDYADNVPCGSEKELFDAAKEFAQTMSEKYGE